MSIVDQTPAAETKRERQRAAVLALAELLESDLPIADMTLVGSAMSSMPSLRVTFYRYMAAGHEAARADFGAWLEHFGIEEYEESDHGDRVELIATAQYKDVEITLTANLSGLTRQATVTRRTVTA